MTQSAPREGPRSCDESTYPQVELDFASFAGLEASPAECVCECGPAEEPTCGPVEIEYHPNSATCDEPSPAVFLVYAGACNPTATHAPGAHYRPAPVEINGGSCSPMSAVNLPEPSWQTQATGCTGAEVLEGCEGDNLCTPHAQSDAAQLCIWQMGDHACPEAYPSKLELHKSTLDERSCEDCTCGDAIGFCDEALVRLWSLPSCQGGAMATMYADGSCNASSLQSNTQSASLQWGEVEGFCIDSNPQPLGGVTASDALTACCL